MTPLNIGLAIAVLVLVALLWKLRHDRARRDAEFDDRPVGSWAAPAAAAPGTEVPDGVPQAPVVPRAATGSSWVVGGGGMDAGGWPAGSVSDPGWPRPGQMPAGWPAVGVGNTGAPQGPPPGVVPGGAPAESASGWERPAPAAPAEDRSVPETPGIVVDTSPAPAHSTADGEPAGLPVWNPPLAAVASPGAPAVAPQPATSDPDLDPGAAWPAWEPVAAVQEDPPTAMVPPSDATATAPVPPGTNGVEESSPWDEAAPWLVWSDETELAVAEQAATAVDAVTEPAGTGATTVPFASLSAHPGLPVAPPDPLGAGRGRFALGGHAMRAGQQAVSGVTFRSSVGVPPCAWAVAPAPEAAPGTLVLHLDGAVNCGVDGLQVVMDAGFAPTDEGFTVRVAAREPGPFLASGTFEIVS